MLVPADHPASADASHEVLILQGAALPVYPPIGRAAHVTGKVVVEMTVSGGQVTSTKVNSGARFLAGGTEANAKTWRFASDREWPQWARRFGPSPCVLARAEFANPLPHTTVAPRAKLLMDRSPRRKIGGQLPPLAARPHHIKHRVHHSPQLVLARASCVAPPP